MALTITKDATAKAVVTSNTVATVTITTAAVNRLAIMYVYCGTGSVVSITGGTGAPTWTRRDRSNTGYEIWTAPLASAQTSQTITVTVTPSQAIIALTCETFFVSGNAYIPTVDAIQATSFNNTTIGNGNVVTQSPTTSVVSYFVAIGPATMVATAGGGYTLSTTPQTWSGGTGIQGSVFATADTINQLSPVSPNVSLNAAASGFMTTLSLSGTPPTSQTIVPQPTSVAATYAAGVGGNPGVINLTWVAPTGQTTTPTGYLIYRLSNADINLMNGQPQRNNNLQPFVQIPWGTLAFTDRQCGYPPILSGGNVYTYYVTAFYSLNPQTAPPTLESILSAASATATYLG